MGELGFRLPQPPGLVRGPVLVIHIKQRRGVVQPNRILQGWQDLLRRGNIKLIEQGAKDTARLSLADGGRLEHPIVRGIAIQLSLHQTQFGQPYGVLCRVDCGAGNMILAVCRVRFLSLLFGFELGMPKMSMVLEEPLERLLQCQLCITEGQTVYLTEVWAFLLILGWGRDEMFIGGGVELLLVAKHVVPYSANTAKCFMDQNALFISGVEFHFHRPLLFHGSPPPFRTKNLYRNPIAILLYAVPRIYILAHHSLSEDHGFRRKSYGALYPTRMNPGDLRRNC